MKKHILFAIIVLVFTNLFFSLILAQNCQNLEKYTPSSNVPLSTEVLLAAKGAAKQQLNRQVAFGDSCIAGLPDDIQLIYAGIFEDTNIEIYHSTSKILYCLENGALEWRSLPFADTLLFQINHGHHELLGIDNTNYPPNSEEFFQLLHIYIKRSNSPEQLVLYTLTGSVN